MQLQELVDVSNAVAEARGRLDKIGKLAQLLKKAAPDEVRLAVAFLSGALLQGRIGIGWSIVSQSRDVAPAMESSLSLSETHHTFDRIASTKGAGATRLRAQLLSDLFRRATSTEQDFLVRLLSGELRQGAQEGVLAEAVAKAAGAPPAAVRQAAMLCGDLGEVACAALLEGVSALSRYTIQLFRPVEPMLASPAESVAEALMAFGQAAFELKLDGARIQVHKSGDDVRVFSRALRDVTAAVPEVVEAVKALSARETILDGEVLALQRDGAPLPFQETMRRFGRRLDVDRLRSDLPLTPFFFDCLYADGRSAHCRAATRAVCRSGGTRGYVCRSTLHHQRGERRGGVLRSRHRERSRRRDGEVARCAVRGRQPRKRVVEDQEGAHTRSRRARRRMGQREAPWMAEQSSTSVLAIPSATASSCSARHSRG